MRIRSIDVRNWGCIESLTLSDLKDGINVLHGPNRTGKSTLVQAIRSTLFDHDHDSQERTLLAAIPWKTKAAPHVAVEFEHGGRNYRIIKTFAKTKEGQAALEQKHASGWSTLSKGKEAAKQVRELLGVDTSNAGVFQLLWLRQQDFSLPSPRDIDPTLAKSLEAVLGNLITGRDLDFKNRLDRAAERWFTVKTMKDRKDSPILRLTADLDQARALNADIDRLWAESESALKQYDEALANHPELMRNLDKAAEELERVCGERESILARKSQYDVAVRHRDAELRQCNHAQKQLKEWDEDAQALAVAEKALDASKHLLQNADDKLRLANLLVGETHQRTEDCERALAVHQQSRSALDDQQQLLHVWTQRESLDNNLDRIQESVKLQSDLEANLAGPAVISEEEIECLRHNRRQATECRAALAAAEIHVTILARSGFNGSAMLDNRPIADILLSPEDEKLWLVRQHAEFTLGEWATLRVGRGKENHDLDVMAQRLAEWDREYRQQVTGAGVDHENPAALDDLLKRHLEHESRRKELKRLCEVVAKSAPAGLPALQGDCRRLREQEEAIRQRRPRLRDWTPNQADVDAAKLDYESRESELQSAVRDGKQTNNSAAENANGALENRQKTNDDVTRQSVAVQNLKEKHALHDRNALAAVVAESEARLVEANFKVMESTLSEAEQAIETLFQSIHAAHANRAKRVRSNENTLAELRGKLAGTEGLHQKRIQAEQAVEDKANELKRESLHANAHKQLKELFEKIREEQVRRTVGPINDRVMGWAQQLGLHEYASLSFGDQLLPSGLVPSLATDSAAIEMQRESYGTLEQLSLLIRLAVGGLLAHEESTVAILDDPLAHADLGKHRKMLEILARASRGELNGPHRTGPLQLIILTCHAERFDYLDAARQFDLAKLIRNA